MAEPPDRYICPITQDVMKDPVMDREGHNFEREGIEQWLLRHDDCPMGREKLSKDTLFPNRALKEEIMEWNARQGAPLPACTPAPAPVQTPLPVEQEDPDRPWTKYSITQQEYDHIFCQFLTFDVDGSGHLDMDECRRLCKFMNYPNRPVDIEQMFAEVDTDRNGTLDIHEFVAYMQHKRPKPELLYGLTTPQYEAFMMQFHSVDVDGDGSLDRTELEHLCRSQGYPHDARTVDNMFQRMDSNRTGKVDAHQFLQYMRYNDPRRSMRTNVMPAMYQPCAPQLQPSYSPTAQYPPGFSDKWGLAGTTTMAPASPLSQQNNNYYNPNNRDAQYPPPRQSPPRSPPRQSPNARPVTPPHHAPPSSSRRSSNSLWSKVAKTLGGK